MSEPALTLDFGKYGKLLRGEGGNSFGNWQAIEDFRTLCPFKLLDGTWLAGGAFRSVVSKSVPTDYDIFFRDVMDALAAGYSLWCDPEWRLIFYCPNGKLFTYKHSTGMKVQLVCVDYYDGMETLIRTFDIVSGMVATDGTDVCYMNQALDDTACKQVTFNVITYPLATLKRVNKYGAYGFSLTGPSAYELYLTIRNGEFNNDQMVYYVD